MSVSTSYFALGGGENLVAPALSIGSGELLFSENYEERLESGYRRIDGYERHDGQPKPSAATYIQIQFTTGTALISTGDIVSNGAGASGTAIIDGVLESGSYAGGDAAGYIVLTNVTGTFSNTDTLQVAAATRCIQSGLSTTAGNDVDHNAWLQLSIEQARTVIGAVPGSGIIRGVVSLNGVVYAFRDNVAATACVMYQSTASGWVAVTTPTLLPGGSYNFVVTNFTGHAGTISIYGCDGVNKAFQFDGTTFTQITTGMTNDAPLGIVEHKKHLFLAFSGGSIQHSAIGDPLTWTPLLGASEISLGDEFTGFNIQQNDTLLITTSNKMFILYGSSTIDWNLTTYSQSTGASANSLVRIHDTYMLSENGLTSLTAVQAFGDFHAGSIGKKIQPVIDERRSIFTCSVGMRAKSQYRTFFADGSFVCGTIKSDGSVRFLRGLYPVPVMCIFNGDDSNGQEAVFFGSDDGYVYQMDSGTSFDGGDVEAAIRVPFNNLKSPRLRKRYRKVVVELEAPLNATIQYQPEFSYGNDDVAAPLTKPISVTGGGGYWGVAKWNEFTWTGQQVSTAEASIEGTGLNMGLLIYSKSIYDDPHTLQGIILHYTVRRLSR